MEIYIHAQNTTSYKKSTLELRFRHVKVILHSDGYFYIKDEWNYQKNIMNMAPGANFQP